MSEMYGFDVFSPKEIAQKVESVGVNKARLPFLQTALLGVLAGVFIGLGSLYFIIVASDATLGFAVQRVLGGVVFCLGLLLVVIAGAELFTGNNLLAMAWADGKITTRELLRNWVIVCFANFLGAAGLAVLVWLSNHPAMNDGAVAKVTLKIAVAKTTMPLAEAFFRGILCNLMVCLAVWMALAGHSVIDKAVAILFPISAFVAAGFEHSVANMYFIPLAMLLQPDAGPITWLGFFHNMIPVIAGNIVGGSGLVALVYWVIYIRPKHAER